MLKINDLITSGESMSVRRPKRRSAFFESASIIIQGRELDSRWDTFNLTRYMVSSEAGPNSQPEGSDQKTTGNKEEPKGIWAKAKKLANTTWEWIKRVFNNFREWLKKTWGDLKKWFNKTFKKKKDDSSPEVKEAEEKVEKAAEVVKTTAENPTTDNIKEATETLKEVAEVLESSDSETVVETVASAPEFVKAADAISGTIVKEAEKVISGNVSNDTNREKVEAIKEAAKVVTNIQKTVTKKMAESKKRRKGMRGAGQIPGSEFQVKKGVTRKQEKREPQWMIR